MFNVTADPRAEWIARAAALRNLCGIFANGRVIMHTDRNGLRHEIDLDRLTPEMRRLAVEQEDAVAQMQSLVDRNTAIQSAADREGRSLSQDERHGIERRLEQFDGLERRVDQIDDTLSAPGQRLTPASSSHAPSALAATAGRTPPAAAGMTGPRWLQMFPRAMAAARQSPFQSLGEFATAVYRNDPRLYMTASGGMSEGIGADGGFFVAPQFVSNINDNSLQQEAIMPLATIVPMDSSSVTIPQFDLSNRSAGIAGLEGKATSEGATGTVQKPKVRDVVMHAHKVQVLVPTTLELMADAPALFGTLLQKAMTDALGQTRDTWFINGTGIGQPLGIMNAPCLLSVAKDASQPIGLTPTNIAGMVARLAPGSWARAVWLVSPSALSALFTMVIIVKNQAGSENVGGGLAPFFQVLPDGKYSLLGRPLYVSDRCQALGTKGDIMLCDLSTYLIGMRQEATLDVDRSIGFKESEIWFRLNCRLDGQPLLAAAITPRVGSATLSPFVTLDTRP